MPRIIERILDSNPQQKRFRVTRILVTGVSCGVTTSFLYILPIVNLTPADPIWRLGFPLLLTIGMGVLNKSIPDAIVSALLMCMVYSIILFYFLLLPVLLGVYTGSIALFMIGNVGVVITISFFLLIISVFGSLLGAILYEFF
ncbi:MAG: hypothetical protein ACTSW4_01560 [Candidatus Ranarchaeia archaeon]